MNRHPAMFVVIVVRRRVIPRGRLIGRRRTCSSLCMPSLYTLPPIFHGNLLTHHPGPHRLALDTRPLQGALSDFVSRIYLQRYFSGARGHHHEFTALRRERPDQASCPRHLRRVPHGLKFREANEVRQHKHHNEISDDGPLGNVDRARGAIGRGLPERSGGGFLLLNHRGGGVCGDYSHSPGRGRGRRRVHRRRRVIGEEQ
mmetsp:Transcript_17121/g.42242  ORF Transcript_17121/g.42242 Transcript_17121/m.42242 type:complete len:201 (+) Transcript_17121:70-672(+)